MPIMKYACKYCGKVYETEGEASQCESKHLHVVEIMKESYSYAEHYPDVIRMKFSDGREMLYKIT